jgi:hypothetical protein
MDVKPSNAFTDRLVVTALAVFFVTKAQQIAPDL